MFLLYADKNNLTVRQREPVTSGSVNVCTVQFEFSEDWENMTRTAVFKAGGVSASVLLDETGLCVIPWEVLEVGGRRLTAGVCGTRGGDTVLPTIWASLGIILEGAKAGQEAQPPTPGLWEQALAGKQDRLTGLPGQVVGFDEAGRAAAQDSSGSALGAQYKYLVVDNLTQYGGCVLSIFQQYPDSVRPYKQFRLDLWFQNASNTAGVYTSVVIEMAPGENDFHARRYLPLDSGAVDAFGIDIEIGASIRQMNINIEDASAYFRREPIRLTIGYLPAEQMGSDIELLAVL